MIHLQKRSHRLLHSYFLTYLSILLIFTVVFLLLYGESAKIIRTDIESENRVLLQQTVDMLDMRIRQLDSFGMQTISKDVITSLRYVEKPLEYPNIQYYFRTQNALPANPQEDFLFDYFLFFNRSELVLSEHLAYTYDDFYNLYMRPVDQNLEEWKASLLEAAAAGNNRQLVRVVYAHGGAEEEKTLIAFSYPFIPSMNRDGLLILYMDQQTLVEPLAAFDLAEGDVAYIESPSGDILATNPGGVEMALALQNSSPAEERTVNLIRRTVNEHSMLISRYVSEQTGFGITIARSSNQVYSRLNKYRWIIAAALALAVLLGVVFSYFFSHRNSSFIRMLAPSSLQLGNMSYRKAFESLRKTFEDIQLRNDAMLQTLATQRPYLQKTFFSQLLSGDFVNEDSAASIAASMNLPSPGEPMRVVLFCLSAALTPGDAKDLQLSVNCISVIRLSIESLEAASLHMSRSENDYVLLISGKRMEERIDRLVKLIRSNLPEDVNECLYVYVGNAVDKLTDVARSWDNAYSMIYLQPSPADVPVIYYKPNDVARLDAFYPPDIQRRLINCVKSGDEKRVAETLNLLFEQNQQSGALPVYIAQLLVNSLLNTLLQFHTLADLPSDRSESMLEDAKNLMTLPLNDQLSGIRTLYTSLCGAFRQQRDGKQQLMDEISDYIRRHFSEVNLSLASVADHFHISESYLSSTFKAQKGANFFNYVEELRIDKAKELLRKTDLKISEIAEQIGYASANSFCRAFKRNTGSSASSYRNGAD